MPTDSSPSTEPPLLHLGAFELDRLGGRLVGPSGPVRLPRRAWDVLLVLVADPGRLVSRDELLELVWEGMVVEEGNLHQTVSVLRRAFAAQDPETVYIETERGRGYRFAAPVVEREAAPEVAAIGGTSRRWPSLRRVVAVGAPLLLVAAAGVALRLAWPPDPHALSGASEPAGVASGAVSSRGPVRAFGVGDENGWLSSSGETSLKPERARQFAAALDALAREDPRNAADLLEPLVEVAPSFAPGWIALAQALRRLGDERRSRDAADRALVLAAKQPEPMARRIEAEAARLRRDFERATELYGLLARSDPRDLELALRFAESLRSAGRFAEARAELGRARDARRDAPDARIELIDAAVLRNQEDFEGALAAGRQALEVASTQEAPLLVSRARQSMGFNLLSLGRAQEALVEAREARRVAEELGASAQLANLLYLEGLALGELGRLGEAEEQLRANLELRERLGYRSYFYLGHHALAALARERGDLAGERRELEVGLVLCQELDLACGRRFGPYLGRNLVDAGELDQGERVLTAALEECRRSMDTEDCTTALRALAALELRRGEPEKAAARLDEALELARRVGQAALYWDLRLDLVAVERARGNLPEAERLLADLEADLPPVDSPRRRQALAHVR